MKKLIQSIVAIFLAAIIFSSCTSFGETSKYEFNDGYYRSKVFYRDETKVYVENSEDSLTVFSVTKSTSGDDTLGSMYITLPQQEGNSSIPAYNFRRGSFDLDFVTIPFKFRPRHATLPRQFNTHLNGAVFIGFRNDLYRIWYKETPTRSFKRRTNHFGFSLGIINGLGGAAINPWVTNNMLAAEYDGVVWSRGVALIIGIDNFTLGAAAGWDALLDPNKAYWIYQNEPWYGLVFGLNLN